MTRKPALVVEESALPVRGDPAIVALERALKELQRRVDWTSLQMMTHRQSLAKATAEHNTASADVDAVEAALALLKTQGAQADQ